MYGAIAPGTAAAGYQASTSTCRTSADVENASLRDRSCRRQVVVPTGDGPVGAGSSTTAGDADRCAVAWGDAASDATTTVPAATNVAITVDRCRMSVLRPRLYPREKRADLLRRISM